MITEHAFVKCSNCLKEINAYYNDICQNQICVDCLVKNHNGEFPKGKGVHLPCNLCQSPYISWYCRNTYGVIMDDCGCHESIINTDSENDVPFDMF